MALAIRTGPSGHLMRRARQSVQREMRWVMRDGGNYLSRSASARVMLTKCNRSECGRVYSGCARHCGEVVFGFAAVGLDNEPILHARFEGIGSDALEGRVHPGNRRSVSKFFCRHGVRFGDQVPNSMRIFVRGNLSQWNDFDGLEFEFGFQPEQDRVGSRICSSGVIVVEHFCPLRPGAMRNMNIIFAKPVSIEVEREAAEHDGQRQKHPLLFRHTR